MRKILMSLVFGIAIAALWSNVASAESAFMKAMKAKYEFRTVSCYTCHMKKSEVPPELLPQYEKESKSLRNEFGQLFVKALEGKKVHERMEKARELKKLAREAESEAEEAKLEAQEEAIEAAVTEDFLEALAKVEAMKDEETGKTYGELLKAVDAT